MIAVIVGQERKLLGIITDGDIRRAIMKGVSFSEPVTKIMNSSPLIISSKSTSKETFQIFQNTHIRHLPVVDDDGKILGIQVVDELHKTVKNDTIVVIMAGGLGSRLGNLTKDCPKPLLNIGNQPILETILDNFISDGFYRFYFSVNYKAEMIESFFGNGEKWGVDIRYIREKERLGTGGALSLMPETPENPVIVMNGDILTRVNFQRLLDFHNEYQSAATMCVREYDFQVPYGVVNIKDHQITKIDEKPVHTFFVNAGIYILSPESLRLIPQHSYFDLPDLFKELSKNKQKTVAFPIREYWIDVGHVDDFNRANGDYKHNFK